MCRQISDNAIVLRSGHAWRLFLCLSPIPAAENKADNPPTLHGAGYRGQAGDRRKARRAVLATGSAHRSAHGHRGSAGRFNYRGIRSLRDADHLYVALQCAGKLAETAEAKPGESGSAMEFADLLINSNADRNSCYLIRITPEDGGKVTCSYNEHMPPWHDRTWQPQFEFAVTQDAAAWTAEFALPFEIFCKNKTLASEIGFNVRRFRIPGPGSPLLARHV